ncbi:MAG TPA: GMC family oxidoreductase N-terminal domain-containing protein, partial [Stellaceae bacterium]|nr:GMC family oxidoreductase N-terminal domain-containing protein [Stellaceae bacterium]
YDYIIVGAGSAGCVVAARLTEDRNVKVLVLEAGGTDRHPLLRIPIAWPMAAWDRRFNWNYETDPEPQLDGRQLPVARGKVLGGSSSINGMGYKRGHPRDYDHWRQLGLEGWSYADVLSYFKRSENSWRGENKFHSVGGPLSVRKGGAAQLLYEPLAAAAQAAGYPICDDISGDQPEGLFVTELTVDSRHRRNSTARAFLYPAMKRPNLTVVTNALTARVAIEKGRAIGVDYVKDGVPIRAHAAREVVLSAGAYNSPQLLMLSGIGPADELKALGIAPLVDLPGVGRNLEEHGSVPVIMAATRPTFLSELRVDRAAWWTMRWALFGDGPFACNGNTAGIFARSRPELERPDIQLTCNTVGLYDRPWWPWRAAKQNYAFNCIVAVIHPESKGKVTLRSADPADKPRIHLNIFGADADIDTCIRGIAMTRELYATEPQKSLVAREIMPGPQATSRDALAAYIRRMATTMAHPTGTCRMGNDEGAVLDAQLRVRGVAGLRVADASVFPSIPGGNTNAPCIMVGEKAADLLLGKRLPPAEL